MTAILDYDLERAKASRLTCEEPTVVRLWLHDWPVGQLSLPASADAIEIERLASVVPADVLAYAREQSARDQSAGRPVPGDASVVICTRDRPEALARCLASLPDQTLAPRQIIVVDNASADGRTREVAEAAGVDYIREDRPGLDIARNTGARAARTAIVAYTDDDVSLHPRWLERLVRAFDAPQIAAVTGLVLPGELETRAQQLFEEHWSFGKGFRRIDFGAEFFRKDRRGGCPVWEIGAGASMAFRRSVFDEVGWFDERLDVGAAGCSGDSEFWHRILSHGLVCRYEPGAVAYHFHRRELAALSSQIFHYLRGHSASLMVQYERTGNFGNLFWAFVHQPLWFTRRGVDRALRGVRGENQFLFAEIRGYLSGLVFYARNRRSKRSPP